MSRLPPGVRRRGDRYQARWRDGTGHQRSATFDSAHEAYRHLGLEAHQRPHQEGPTIGDWAIQWAAGAPGRPSTRARDDSYLRTHILPEYAPRPLASLTAWEIQQWVAVLAKRLAPGSVHKVVGVLSKLLAAAEHAGHIDANPCRSVVLPTIDRSEARFLTPAEIVRLDKVFVEHHPHWAELVTLLADTGLRIGELAALRVGDLDLEAGSLRVQRGLVEVRGKLHIGPPKSRHGVRTVPTLTATTVQRIVGRIERLGLCGSDSLFCAPRGGSMRPSLFRARTWRPAVRAAELSVDVTPHTLRHTAVALWIAAGVNDPHRLARWAGHRDPSTIYRVYAHLLPEDSTVVRDRLEVLRAQDGEDALVPAHSYSH